MKIITAPEEYIIKDNDFCIFLAGGITGCPDWQKEVIEHLTYKLPEPIRSHIVIFNPRRDNFPIDKPDASKEQIVWEYKYIKASNLFTMYFCEGQIQPICLFELGRMIEYRMGSDIVVTSHPLYPRIRDINIQTACRFGIQFINIGTPEDHAENICDRVQAIFISAEAKDASRNGYPYHR